MGSVPPPNNRCKQTSLLVVNEVDPWPFFNRALDARSQSSVGQQPLGHVGDKNRVADIGVTCPDLVHREMIGKMAWTYNFDAIIKDEEPDWCTDQIVAVHQGIYQQLFKDNYWNLGNARRVDASPSLSLVQIALDEPHGAIKDLAKRTSIIFGVQILGRVDVDAGGTGWL